MFGCYVNVCSVQLNLNHKYVPFLACKCLAKARFPVFILQDIVIMVDIVPLL
jgi:hypothetical protein